MNGSRILVLGLAYKRNSSDARETPATGVIHGLIELGAEVRVHDGHVGAHAVDSVAERVSLTPEELALADCVVILTDHDDIDYDLVVAEAAYVFDTRHRLSATSVESL